VKWRVGRVVVWVIVRVVDDGVNLEEMWNIDEEGGRMSLDGWPVLMDFRLLLTCTYAYESDALVGSSRRREGVRKS